MIWCLTQASSISFKFCLFVFIVFVCAWSSLLRVGFLAMMSRICALVGVHVLLIAVAFVVEHATLGMWASVAVAAMPVVATSKPRTQAQ